MGKELISTIRQELNAQADEKTRASGQAFFKEKITFYGVNTAAVSKIGRKYYQEIKNLSKEEIFSLCEELFRSDYCEEAYIACAWVYNLRAKYEPDDFLIFENWLAKYINNWAKCDTFCNHAIGAFMMRFPQYLESLQKWTKSENRWLRRAAAVTLIIPAKQGLFLEDILQIANRLLKDKDDLVQKGYGWMLKEASRKHQREIFNYVISNKEVMPRTALRYAIEKMPEDLRHQAMQKN